MPDGRQRDMGVAEVDPYRPCAARVYDYLLGGRANFVADRRVARAAAGGYPGGMEGLRGTARANRAFIGRAVEHLAGAAEVCQFLDLGTGIPGDDNVHAVAQRVAPESRIVCVDYDPVVLAHAHRLVTSRPEGAAAFLRGDIRDVEWVLEEASKTLDLDRPVAVMLVALLHFFPDDNQAYDMVARYMDATAPGSYLVITHGTSDFIPGVAEAASRVDEAITERVQVRTRAQVARFFDGLNLIDPGLVAVDHWRNGPDRDSPFGYYAAVGRKVP